MSVLVTECKAAAAWLEDAIASLAANIDSSPDDWVYCVLQRSAAIRDPDAVEWHRTRTGCRLNHMLAVQYSKGRRTSTVSESMLVMHGRDQAQLEGHRVSDYVRHFQAAQWLAVKARAIGVWSLPMYGVAVGNPKQETLLMGGWCAESHKASLGAPHAIN